MEKTIKILLGFNLVHKSMDKETEDKIRKHLQAQGYEPVFVTRRKKKEIQKYLQDNRDCSHAVLMESADDSVWTENELADLVDERSINIVIILTAAKVKQLTYLTTLYAAGITSALFEYGGHGVPEEEVAELLLRPRSRKAAREYYKIDTKNISVRSLTNEMYNGLIVKLADTEYGVSAIARLLNIADSLNPYQMGDFLEKLPSAILEDISRYAEYGQLVDQLKKSGIHVRYKRPKSYRYMEDDLAFNESAREVYRKNGYDTSVFDVPQTPKKGWFRSRKQTGGNKQSKQESMAEETSSQSIISTFYDWGDGIEEPDSEIPVGEEVDLDLRSLTDYGKNGDGEPMAVDEEDGFLVY